MLERDQLKADQRYFLWERHYENGSYFYCLDGVGGYWYDTLDEMEEQHGDGRVIESQIPGWF